MCGIAGVLTRPGEGIAPAALSAMGNILNHRGPDDRGYLFWRGTDEPVRARSIQCDAPLRLDPVNGLLIKRR